MTSTLVRNATIAGVAAQNQGKGKDDKKEDFSHPYVAFKHLLAIITVSVIVLSLSLLWTQFLNLLFTKIFSAEFWNPLMIRFAVCVVISLIGIAIIYLLHLGLGMSHHLEDHMS